ncbi:MAG: phosphoenolpyruvate carboxykinase (ATP) [Candidatus Promineifilaceae bacterium]
MQHLGTIQSTFGLENHGITDAKDVFWNLTPPQLYEQALQRREGVLSADGAFIVHTGEYTGRSPKDKYVVQDAMTNEDVWWGSVNQPVSQETYESVKARMMAHMADRDLFVFDGYVGADPTYRMPTRVVTEYAWQSLFARNMLIREDDSAKLAAHEPTFTIIDMPNFFADPELDGTRSGTFVFVNFSERTVLIGGTQYAGEIKKSAFTALNYYLPRQGVMSMHCSANYGETKEDTALFFGLSGTGKTTLSNDPNRPLIGDDEHGWSDNGVFNYEGGCYAKVINLDAEGEPEIFATTKRFGTIIENVVYDSDTREIDYTDSKYTQNTRVVYPITHLSNVDLSGQTSHAKNIVFLTADAFGILPPISRLTREQAMYYFLSGYTAKVAGTERGVTEPIPDFSACFGAPFLPLHPGVYGELLGKKMDEHGAKVWLINTGWSGGTAATASRIKLRHTRRMVTAALTGELDQAEMSTAAFFNLSIPTAIEGVPSEILNPRHAWADTAAYDAQASHLVELFVNNFKNYASGVSAEVSAAGPTLA